MAAKISVYLDDKTVYKLGDIKRMLDLSSLGTISISRAITYCILKTWQAEFVDSLNTANWSDEVRKAVAKYAPNPGGNGGGEQ